MSSTEDAKKTEPLAEEPTKNLRPPRTPVRSGVVRRVEPIDEDARETARLPVVTLDGPVTEIAPPPSRDPRRD